MTTISNNDFEKANSELEQELEKQTNILNKYERINQYAQQDDIMVIYINKILNILYLVIFIIFTYSLYTNSNVSRIYFISMIAIFMVIPFTFWLIGKYITETFLKPWFLN